MLNDRMSAARGVAEHLFPTEHQIEQAILTSSLLAIAIIEGRRSAKLPISTGQEGLENVCRVQRSLVEARRNIAAAHVSLRCTQSEIGLGAVSFGDVAPCPPMEANKEPLRVVTAA